MRPQSQIINDIFLVKDVDAWHSAGRSEGFANSSLVIPPDDVEIPNNAASPVNPDEQGNDFSDLSDDEFPGEINTTVIISSETLPRIPAAKDKSFEIELYLKGKIIDKKRIKSQEEWHDIHGQEVRLQLKNKQIRLHKYQTLPNGDVFELETSQRPILNKLGSINHSNLPVRVSPVKHPLSLGKALFIRLAPKFIRSRLEKKGDVKIANRFNQELHYWEYADKNPPALFRVREGSVPYREVDLGQNNIISKSLSELAISSGGLDTLETGNVVRRFADEESSQVGDKFGKMPQRGSDISLYEDSYHTARSEQDDIRSTGSNDSLSGIAQDEAISPDTLDMDNEGLEHSYEKSQSVQSKTHQQVIEERKKRFGRGVLDHSSSLGASPDSYPTWKMGNDYSIAYDGDNDSNESNSTNAKSFQTRRISEINPLKVGRSSGNFLN